MREFTKMFAVVTVAIVLFGFASPAKATPITYVQSGNASGTIGGSTFTDKLVTVTLTGDTSRVGLLSPIDPLFPGVLVNVGPATVNIPGIGTATITDPTAIYSTVTAILIDTGLPVLPYVIFGTLDNPPSTRDFTGIGGIGSNSLLGYDLRTSIGPITTSPGGVGSTPSLLVHTTLGNLAFTTDIAPTSMGTFTATTTPVPEPSSLLLSGMCAIMLVGARLRQRS